ncbi:uncharacterized protein [Engystomops pustulosus]|uniref:uncharacterized protein isoform X2 n=1 Tax=Engystomops pustulosus TaxID=76066 RepID=UPI003AFA096E
MAAPGRTRSAVKPQHVPAKAGASSKPGDVTHKETGGCTQPGGLQRPARQVKETGGCTQPGALQRPARQVKETTRAPELQLAEEIPALLVDTRLPREMSLQPATETAIRNLGLSGAPTDLIKNNQAINSDYTGSNYHKGHLNPNADHPDGAGQKATYTLTNVAPMYGSLNSGAWRNNEKRVRDIAATCGRMYVITGVVPGNNWISVNGVQRINIPSHVWSAFCCLDNNNRPVRAEGSLAPNNANSVQAGLSIASLQSQLRSLMGVTVTLFNNNCS